MHNDDAMVGRLLTRRELVALFGASGLAAIVGPAAGQTAGKPTGMAACVVQPQQTEGPYFVDEKLNRSDVRADPARGKVSAGAPLDLMFKVSQVGTNGACVALAGAQVDIWQCDAMGVYSGVQDKSFDTRGQKFLRGYQLTDATGSARFTTIYPGWYPGRAVHIHFKIRTSPPTAPAYEFTSQLYFDEAFTDRVHKRDPYIAHSGERTRNENDRIYRDEGGSQLILPVSEAGSGYEGMFAVAMRLGEPGRGRGGRGASGSL